MQISLILLLFFFLFAVQFFLRFAVLFLSVCKRYSTHVTFSLLHCFKRSLFKFFFVLLNVSFFFFTVLVCFLTSVPLLPLRLNGVDGAKLLKI